MKTRVGNSSSLVRKMVPQQHTQESLNVTPQSPSSAGPIESATTNLNILNTPPSRGIANQINMDTSPCENFYSSNDFDMDIDNGNYNLSNSLIFGSRRVDVNSSTPYSDATQTKKHSPNHIKRPMNSFMVFSQHRRREICDKTPEIHNAEISKRLGIEWKKLTEEERKPYKQESEMLRKLHQKEYPNYKYRPQKKHSKSSKTATSSSSSSTTGESNNNSPNSPSTSSSCSPQQYNNNQQHTSPLSEVSSPSTSGKSTANSRRTKRSRTTNNSSGTSNKRHKNDTNNNNTTTNKTAHHQFQLIEEQQQQQQHHQQQQQQQQQQQSDPLTHHQSINNNRTQDYFDENSTDRMIIIKDEIPLYAGDSSMVGYDIENCSEFDDNNTIVKDPNLNTASLQTKLPTAASTFNNLRQQPHYQADIEHLLSEKNLHYNSPLHSQHDQQHVLYPTINPNFIHHQLQLHNQHNTHHPNNNNDTMFCPGQPTVTMNVNVAKVDDYYYRSNVTDESDCSMITSEIASPQDPSCFNSDSSLFSEFAMLPLNTSELTDLHDIDLNPLLLMNK